MKRQPTSWANIEKKNQKKTNERRKRNNNFRLPNKKSDIFPKLVMKEKQGKEFIR